MSVIAAPRPARERTVLELYRDDGPLARALAMAGARLPLPASLLVALGVVPVFALIAIEGEGASKGAVAAVLAWLVVTGGLSSARPHTDRFRWAVPPLLRAVEYSAYAWLGALAGGSGAAAAFAFLCALAFRHYDLVYRLRHQGTMPPDWVGMAGGGWEGRIVLAYLFFAADAMSGFFFIAAGLLAALFVTESVASWRHFGRSLQPVLYDDEEDAAE